MKKPEKRRGILTKYLIVGGFATTAEKDAIAVTNNDRKSHFFNNN